jgi:hypothetical protein
LLTAKRQAQKVGTASAVNPEYNVQKFAFARRRAVKKLPLLVISVLLCALSTSAQKRWTMPNRPEPMNTDTANSTPEQATTLRRINLEQLQKEADDLARTAQTIPSDLANVRKGMLPKDVLQKLKQIEKLSKHLRSELNQ